MISVIVPIYNAEPYLQECIDSILNQSFQDIELILVNDGSKDNSLSICRSYSDNRVFVIDKPNGGVSSARNRGIIEAHGEYLAFVDSDDIIPQNALAMLYSSLLESNVDMSCGRFVMLYGEKKIVHSLRLKQGVYHCPEIINGFIDDGTLSGFLIGSVCGGLYKKSIIADNHIWFNENVKYNEDGLFNFEYAIHAQTLRVIDDCVYCYRQEVKSSSSNRPQNIDYNGLIKQYINSLNLDENIYLIDIQFKRRSVSTALWDILNYPSKMRIINGRNFIKQRIQSIDVTDGISYIQTKQLQPHKRIFFVLMRFHFYTVLYLLVRFCIPCLKSRWTR